MSNTVKISLSAIVLLILGASFTLHILNERVDALSKLATVEWYLSEDTMQYEELRQILTEKAKAVTNRYFASFEDAFSVAKFERNLPTKHGDYYLGWTISETFHSDICAVTVYAHTNRTECVDGAHVFAKELRISYMRLPSSVR